MPLSELGLNPDGSVQVPTNFNVPGWYKFGPTPGERGSAVILGHVDIFRGPAVFFYLRDLRPGNQVIVQLADHKIARFAALGLRVYTKALFPEKIVYGSRPYSALQLVTCGRSLTTPRTTNSPTSSSTPSASPDRPLGCSWRDCRSVMVATSPRWPPSSQRSVGSWRSEDGTVAADARHPRGPGPASSPTRRATTAAPASRRCSLTSAA